jgi:isoquinoline 1-oxidoreductase alpha subunit
MTEDGSGRENTPAAQAPNGDWTTKLRGTRRAVIAGAGAVTAAVLAACGATTKKKVAATVVAKKPDTVTNSQFGPGFVPTQPTKLTLNGESVEVEGVEGTMLLYVLRDQLGQHGPKFGCGLSECGACAVLLDGTQIRSCVTPLASVQGRSIVTLDGLAASYDGPGKTLDGMHPLQNAWIEHQVPQCGYCQSGMIIQAADLLTTNPKPTVAEIKEAMNGHLCRCGTYNSIVKAIQSASEVMS